jgi:two-component system, sporulation sensor kinase E
MKSGFVDKLIERVDRVEPEEVQAFLNRLAEESGFFKSVFDALQEGVIVADAEGMIHYINRAACLLFGLDSGDATGAHLGDKVPGLDWASLVTSGTDVVSRDIEVFYPENRYLNFYIKPVEGQSDAPTAYVMLVRDTTEHRRSEEEKIESERFGALTLLAAGIAHEIGNPLNSLNIHLQLLERKLKKAAPDLFEAELREFTEIATGEVKRLDHIIDQFLKAIRPSRPRLVPTDVNALIREAMRFLEPELKDRGLEITLELHSALPPLHLDADQIKQAFYNIVKNAAAATPPGGAITVRSDLNDEQVALSFTDTGEGISAADMSNLFQPYFTTKESGTGLGLLIVRRIAREHGGEIEFASEQGKGTTVTMFLPRFSRGVRLLPEPSNQ